MHIEDPDRNTPNGAPSRLHKVGALRLIALEAADFPQRRRTPRRRLVMPVSAERRRADRRHTTPGVDGLLRTVLADEWQ